MDALDLLQETLFSLATFFVGAIVSNTLRPSGGFDTFWSGSAATYVDARDGRFKVLSNALSFASVGYNTLGSWSSAPHGGTRIVDACDFR